MAGPVLLAPGGGVASSVSVAAVPRALLSVTAQLRASGRLVVSVSSNAKKASVRYKVGKRARVKTVKLRRGTASVTLPKGARKVTARARGTKKLRASAWLPVADTFAPATVTGLTVASVTTSSIGLSWTLPVDADLTGVVVRRADGSTPPTSPSAGVEVFSGLSTTAAASGLSAGAGYAFAVFTRDVAGNWSAPVTVAATTASVPDNTPPGPVTGLTVSGVTTTSIELSWANPPDGDLADAIVRRADGSTPAGSPSGGVEVLPSSGTSAAATGLSPGTAHAFTVFTRDTAGNVNPMGVTVTGTTQSGPMPLAVAGEITTQVGSSALVTLPNVTSLDAVTAVTSPDGVSWSASGGALQVNAAMTAAPGISSANLTGTGCVDSDCGRALVITVAVTVTGLQAPVGEVLDLFVEPSGDRVAFAKDLGVGMAVLGDEVTIVLADADLSRATGGMVAASVGALVAGGDELLGIYQLRWTTAQDIQARLAELVADPRVASAEGGLLFDIEPADVAYDNETAYGANDRWHLDLIHAPQAWQSATGAGVTIGILEKDHVSNHADLPPVHRGGQQLAVGSHATHVAGLACAQDNGLGVIGVAYDCSLESRTFKDTGPTSTYLPKALKELKGMIGSGAKVVNNSWGQSVGCRPVETIDGPNYYLACGQSHLSKYRSNLDAYLLGDNNAFAQTMAKVGAGVVVVNAAGNNGMPAGTNPWSYMAARSGVKNVLTVAMVDADGNLNWQSNFGPGIDVAAPGGEGPAPQYLGILSTVYNFQNPYGRESGTSMAAPMVAGEAALVAQLHPDWTGIQIADCIRTSATKPVASRNDDRAPDPPAGGDGLQFTYPAGSIPIVDAAKAVHCGEGGPDPGLLPRTIAAGHFHSCALDSAGQAWCWGMGMHGQLGDGDTTGAQQNSPVKVTGGHVFATIAAGNTQSCAVDVAGQGWCWGSDAYGGLGDGDTTGTTKFAPVAVTGGHTFTTISAGYYHSCALDIGGQGWCWGYGYGGIGDGDSTSTNKYTPVPVTGGHTFTTIVAGYARSCALDTAGQGWCWGLAGDGGLGDGDITGADKYSPVAVTGGHEFTAIDTSSEHSCALDTVGQAWCWGSDSPGGGLGDGDPTGTTKFAPVAVTGGHTFTSITAGSAYSCALDKAEQAWCWGYGWGGLLGDGDTTGTDKASPVAVAGGHAFSAISSRNHHSCAWDAVRQAWCWGYDDHGQLGDGDAIGTTFAPVAVVDGRAWSQP